MKKQSDLKKETVSPPPPPPPPAVAKKSKGMYSPPASIAILLFIFFGSQIIGGIITGLLLSAYTTIAGGNVEELFDQMTTRPELQALFIFITEAIAIYLLWLFMKARRISWKDLGMGRKLILKDLKLAGLGYVIYFGSFLIISMIAAAFVDTDQEQQLGFDNVVTIEHLILVFISLVILPPIVEEILFRGFLYSGLRTKLTKWVSAIVVSVLFGIAHLQLGSDAPPLWIAMIDTFILSMILVWLREKTGAIWAGMLVHGFKNFLAYILLFVVKLD